MATELTTTKSRRIIPRERLALSLLGLFLLFMGACWWMQYSAERQGRLNDDLIAAIYRGNSARVLALLERGADPNAMERTSLSSSPGGLERLLRLFRRESASERAAKQGAPFILRAARKGNPDIIRDLIHYGANVKARDLDGNNPLSEAVSAGKLEASRVLLDAGCDVNQKGMEDRTPIWTAVEVKNAGMVRLLLAHGAQVNGRYSNPFIGDMMTIVDFAKYMKASDIVKILQKAGAK